MPTGRNLLDFVRPGATLYRSTHGIREQVRRRRKGMRVDVRSVVVSQKVSGEIRIKRSSSTD
jgi:hypothetical protein